MDSSLFIAQNSHTRNPRTKLYAGNSRLIQYKMPREVCSLLSFSEILFLLEQFSRKVIKTLALFLFNILINNPFLSLPKQAFSLSSRPQLSLGICFALLTKNKIFASQLQMSKLEFGSLVGSTALMKMARSSFPIRKPTKTSKSLQSMENSLSSQISLWRQKNITLPALTCTTKNPSCKEVKLRFSFTFPWT